MPVQSSLPTTPTSLSTFIVSMFCCKILNTRFKPSYWSPSRWLPQSSGFWYCAVTGLCQYFGATWSLLQLMCGWISYKQTVQSCSRWRQNVPLKYCCQTYCHYITSVVCTNATERRHKPAENTAFHATYDPFFPLGNVPQNQTVPQQWKVKLLLNQ